MIKAAITTLSLILLCGAGARAADQPSPSQIAGEEAVRRQADAIQLRRTLANAATARTKGDLVASAKLYEEAFQLVMQIGVGVDQERLETVAGLADVRLELAGRAQKRIHEADAGLARVESRSENLTAQKFKESNDKKIATLQGRVPSKDSRLRCLNTKPNGSKPPPVQDGRLLMEMGKLEEAKAKLKLAVREDPKSAAFYYLALIEEQLYAQETRKREVNAKEALVEVEKAWNPPSRENCSPFPIPCPDQHSLYRHRAAGDFSKARCHCFAHFGIPGEVPLSEVVKELDSQITAIVKTMGPRSAESILSSARTWTNRLPQCHLDRWTYHRPIIASQSRLTNSARCRGFHRKTRSPLTDVRVADILDAIVKWPSRPKARRPIQGSSIRSKITLCSSARKLRRRSRFTRARSRSTQHVQGRFENILYSPSPFAAVGGVGGQGVAVAASVVWRLRRRRRRPRRARRRLWRFVHFWRRLCGRRPRRWRWRRGIWRWWRSRWRPRWDCRGHLHQPDVQHTGHGAKFLHCGRD